MLFCAPYASPHDVAAIAAMLPLPDTMALFFDAGASMLLRKCFLSIATLLARMSY